MPDLWRYRKALFPSLEEAFPKVKFVLEAKDDEVVGVVEQPPAGVRETLRSHESVYANNTAALKEYGDEWEVGSYAYREDGFFWSKWQYHIRLFPYPTGTLVIEHKEINPWYDPMTHYGPTWGETWFPASEYDPKAEDLLDIVKI